MTPFCHCLAIFFLVFSSLVHFCRTDVFTAMVDVQSLLFAEKHVVDVIEQYIGSEMSRLEHLKRFAELYQLQNEQTIQLGSDYITNPINSYLLIKRLTSDWDNVVSLMMNNMAETFLQNITSQRETTSIKFPDQEDLKGAAIALMRLQDVYKLETSDIAHGKIRNVNQAEELKAINCFELGLTAHNEEDFYHSLMWMQEAYNRTVYENPVTISQTLVLDYLAFAMSKQGNILRALTTLQMVKEIDPTYINIDESIQHFEYMLSQQISENSTNKLNAHEVPPIINQRTNEYFEDYEALCRGEQSMTSARVSKLYCYYKRNTPFLLLAPLKAEIVHLKPKIIVFRQIISDVEIEALKEIATPRLTRSGVINTDTGKGQPASYRISKNSWVYRDENPTVVGLFNRIADVTDLNMDTAEPFQIANYGLGGHYEAHYDFALKEHTKSFEELGFGNRIATLLTYLSTPEAGGATVFPNLMISLFPSKNDAVFWWNLLKNGEVDMSTLHAACPVLAGSKWVSNMWIHEYGQEFTRPCALHENEYE